MLDVNARAWGWIAACLDADVEFPYLLWQMLHGKKVSPAQVRPGIRWVRTFYDLMASIQEMRHGNLKVGDYFESLKNAEHEMYILDDPLPALFEIPLLFKLTWNKLNKR